MVIGADVTAITILFPNWFFQASLGVKNPGNSMAVIECAFEYNGTFKQVFFGGSASATFTSGSNNLSDALQASTFSLSKFTKGTVGWVRTRFRYTTPATDQIPSMGGGKGLTSCYRYDPRKLTITNGILGTGLFTFTMQSVALTGATATGTAVTATVASTTGIVSGTNYIVGGATGTGTALNYNGTFTINVVDGVTISYTATSAPSATATGSLTISAINNNLVDVVSPFGIYMPLILGYHSSPVPVMIGDSKTYGTGDAAPVGTGAGGMSRLVYTDATNPATAIFPVLNMGVPSGNAAEWSTSVGGADITLASSLLQYGTHAVIGYGTNGFQTTQQQTLYGIVRTAGISKIIQRSMTPNTTSQSVSITSLVSTGSACTATVASTAAMVNGGTYTISGATPAAYNGSYVVSISNGTTFTYTSGSAPGSTATGSPVALDNFRTLTGQVATTGWSVGGTGETYETTLKGWTSSDVNLTYYQSQAERAGTSGLPYWQWGVNGTAFYTTSDGKHESAVGYELNIRTAGTATTQSGTVSTSLATLVAAFT
jgi:hypothetical protein